MAYRKRSDTFADKYDDFKNWWDAQPGGSKFLSYIVIGLIVYVTFLNPHDRKFYRDAAKEVQIARYICETSIDWVMLNRKRLKLGHSDLRNFKYDGKNTANFKRMSYPEILFYDTGVRSAIGDDTNHVQLLCTYKDPRDNSKHYYNYRIRSWVSGARYHR